MCNSIVVDETTLNVQNLFTNKGVILGDEDIQNICNYAIANGLVKLEMSTNIDNAGDIYIVGKKEAQEVVVNFADEDKTVVIKPISKEEREEA